MRQLSSHRCSPSALVHQYCSKVTPTCCLEWPVAHRDRRPLCYTSSRSLGCGTCFSVTSILRFLHFSLRLERPAESDAVTSRPSGVSRPLRLPQRPHRWRRICLSSARNSPRQQLTCVDAAYPLADRERTVRQFRQHYRGKTVRDVKCPYPRKDEALIHQERSSVQLGGPDARWHPSSLSFVLSAADGVREHVLTGIETMSTIHSTPASGEVNFDFQSTHEWPTSSVRPQRAVTQIPEAVEPIMEKDDFGEVVPVDCPRISEDPHAHMDRAPADARNNFRKKGENSVFTRERDNHGANARKEASLRQNSTFLASSQVLAKDRLRRFSRPHRLYSAPVTQTVKTLYSSNTASLDCGSRSMGKLLRALRGNKEEWAAVLEQGRPLDVLTLYSLLATCYRTTKRLRCLPYMLNKTILDRLHHLHIDDIAVLMHCMKEVGHLRTDFLLAVSPFIASTATRASAKSCFCFLESYAALRFFVAGPVGALCEALAHPEKSSSMNLSQVAGTFACLACLNIRPERLLMALSEQFLRCWSCVDPSLYLPRENEGQKQPLSCQVPSCGFERARARRGLDAPGGMPGSLSHETLNHAELQPLTGTAPSGPASVKTVSLQASPDDITFLLYSISKLQWIDPRLVHALLKMGVPMCATKMHSHQLTVAAIALARLIAFRTAAVLPNESGSSFDKAAFASAHAGKLGGNGSSPVRSTYYTSCFPVGAASPPRESASHMPLSFRVEAATALQQIVNEACRRLPQFKAESLCMFLGACAAVPLQCSLLIAGIAAHLPRLILTFRSEDTLFLMAALSKLNACSPAIVDIVIFHVRQHICEYSFAAAQVYDAAAGKRGNAYAIKEAGSLEGGLVNAIYSPNKGLPGMVLLLQSLLKTCCLYGVIRADCLSLASKLSERSDIHPASLSKIFCALCNCGYNAPELFLPLFAALEACVLLMTVDELADICASAALLGLQAHPLLQPHVANAAGALRLFGNKYRISEPAPIGYPPNAENSRFQNSRPPSKAAWKSYGGENGADDGWPLNFDSAVNFALASLICPPFECGPSKRWSKLRRTLAAEIVSLTGGIAETLEREANAGGSFCMCCEVMTPSQLRRIGLLCGAMILMSKGRGITQTHLPFTARLRGLLAEQVQRMLTTAGRLPCQPCAMPLPVVPSCRDTGTYLPVYRSKSTSSMLSSISRETGRLGRASVYRRQQCMPTLTTQSIARLHDHCSACGKLQPSTVPSTCQKYPDTSERVLTSTVSADVQVKRTEVHSAYSEGRRNYVMARPLELGGQMKFGGSVPERLAKQRSFLELSCMTGLLAIQTVLEQFFEVRGRLHVGGTILLEQKFRASTTDRMIRGKGGARWSASFKDSGNRYPAPVDMLPNLDLETINPYSNFLELQPWEIVLVKRSGSIDGGQLIPGCALRQDNSPCQSAEVSSLEYTSRPTRGLPARQRRLSRRPMRSRTPRDIILADDEPEPKSREHAGFPAGVAIIWGDAAHFWHDFVQTEHKELQASACHDSGSVLQGRAQSPNLGGTIKLLPSRSYPVADRHAAILLR